ncbi:MAG: ABC transporter permease [Planctomycetes bacterium]|nr:ABC transporter permease [Planctomycetota bacterium]
MNAFLAIIHDTWRQSKHQWVLIVLIGLQVMLAIFAVAAPEKRTAPDGSEFFTTRWARDTDQKGMEIGWEGLYADALRDEQNFNDTMKGRSKEVNALIDQREEVSYRIATLIAEDPNHPDLDALRDQNRALEQAIDRFQRDSMAMQHRMRLDIERITAERTADMPRMAKGVEFWLSGIAYAIFILSMIGFIAACSIYIPNMLEQGSIDLVLSKPIRRWQIYFGKYVGGLLLYSAALTVLYVVVFVGVGIVSGVWHWPFFGALPMTIFSLALLYSIVAWVGLWTRSTALAMVIGYVYYLVVDTAVGHMEDLPFIEDFPAIDQLSKVLKFSFPSFVWLRESAEASVLSVYVFPWQHLAVGALWLFICLGTSYNRFRINDY